MERTKYSIIIPCYNGEKTIERALDSIKEQKVNEKKKKLDLKKVTNGVETNVSLTIQDVNGNEHIIRFF